MRTLRRLKRPFGNVFAVRIFFGTSSFPLICACHGGSPLILKRNGYGIMECSVPAEGIRALPASPLPDRPGRIPLARLLQRKEKLTMDSQRPQTMYDKIWARHIVREETTIAVPDHNVPTTDRSQPITDEISRRQIETLRANCAEFGIRLYDIHDPLQGVIHVVGPEQGYTRPGMTIVCGDSHTATTEAGQTTNVLNGCPRRLASSRLASRTART